MNSRFEDAYRSLNSAQRQAVDTLEGPVMVVAGPGTGKTQILALRIANILQKTDTGASGILCLTFTNSGVSAMRKRLIHYIGSDATKVRIATFHSFAFDLVQKNFQFLDFEILPELLDEAGGIALADEILESHDWEYLRPRANSAQYFRDVKSLIALLKREQITPDAFLVEIDNEISNLTTDPASISTRGESKGSLKKDIEKKIESLNRTREVVKFYELYEIYKKERGYIDYDDVLRLLVTLVSESEEVRDDLRESFLYVLVDEHQDSSGVQNEFLERVWKETERPNIFVVGDDRQLIYGFGGASLSYFENFKTMFGRATCITLVENYRSSQAILDVADALLQSSIASDTLRSNHSRSNPLTIYEVTYPRDEIILAGMKIKEEIACGTEPHECAILVPKNAHVRSALTILRDMGIPVAMGSHSDLFMSYDASCIRTVLTIISNPYESSAIAEYLLSPYSKVTPLEAHQFLHGVYSRELSIETLRNEASKQGANLLSGLSPISQSADTLSDFIEYGTTHTVYETIQYIGEALLLDTALDHDTLVSRAEVIRTLLHLALTQIERNPNLKISEYLEYLDRLESYGESIPLAVFGKDDGVKVMTMHASKGLEFEFVWIAHMDEKSLMRGKKGGFVLPQKIEDLLEEKDELVVKRQVYVAMTRAKSLCSFSYALEGYTGGAQTLASIFEEIPDNLIQKKSQSESEALLLAHGPIPIVTKKETGPAIIGIQELTDIVRTQYEKSKVSVTLLNNFFECPWKWYFRNLLQLPEVKSTSLLFGSVVHEVIEKILKSDTIPNDEMIAGFVSSSLEKNNVQNPNDIRRLSADAQSLVGNWMRTRFPHLAQSRISERSVSYKNPEFPHLTFYGKIDLTEGLGDGEVRVTDFKTGKPKTKSEIEKNTEEGRLSNYLRQLVMYSYLIHGAESKNHVLESVLEFLEAEPNDKNARYSTHITGEHLRLLEQDILDYDVLLQSGEWVNRPCYYTGYGQNTECVECARARRVYGEIGTSL